MTRISSFGLYECPNCAQIHIKPEYGSISIHVPSDLNIQLTAIKMCKQCRWAGKFSEFKYLELKSKVYTREPSKVELLIRRVLKKPYIELDVRKLYPKLE